jgi:streptogramin lyase
MMRVRGLRTVGLAILIVMGVSLVLCSAAFAQYTADGEPESFGVGGSALGITVETATGDVYALSGEAKAIEKFNEEGVPVKFAEQPGNSLHMEGAGVIEPYQIAVDNSTSSSKGDLYVAALGNVLFKFDGSGKADADATFSPPGGFTEVSAVAVGNHGEVYAGDFATGNIYEFSPEGTPLNSGNPVLTGTANPNAMTIGPEGNLYVAEVGAHETAEFAPEPSGVFNPTPVRTFYGGGEGSTGVAVDATGDVFIDNYRGSISEYNANGELIGEPFGTLAFSLGFAVNENTGTLYSSNNGTNTVDLYVLFVPETKKPPGAFTAQASEVREVSALLKGKVAPHLEATTYQFELWEKEETDAEKIPFEAEAIPPIPGTSEYGYLSQAVSQLVSGLEPNTVYHYRVVATNSLGTTKGAVQSFETSARPKATTLATSDVTVNSAILSGSLDPEAKATTYSFEYGLTTGYGQSLPLAKAGAERNTEAVSLLAENLTPNTTYHYRLVAINEDGTSYGEDHVFTTSANPPPVAVTLPASEVAQNTATLNGTVNPDGQRTRYEFQIGTGSEYGVNVFFDAGSGKETESVALPIGDLQPGTTYHYRIVATSEGGSSEGADQTFTTAIFPTAALSAPPTTALLATPPIAFPTSTTGTTTKTTVTKTKGKKKTKAKKKPKHKARK